MKNGLVVLILILFSACVSKRHAPIQGPVPPGTPSMPAVPPPGAPSSETLGDKPILGPTPQESGTPSPAKPPSEKPHVTLVVGGAGVASFATVGILKRLEEERIHIDAIVATGWPALFAVAYGSMKSVHDVEWFAMRLQKSDFGSEEDFASHESLSALIRRSIPLESLERTKLPVIIAADNTLGTTQVYDSGEWVGPLLKTMSVPGMYRPYPDTNVENSSIQSLKGINVDEAQRRGAQNILAVEMYEDYVSFVRQDAAKGSAGLFKQLYVNQLRKSIREELANAGVASRIKLGKLATDFSVKRLAILAGYKDATRSIRRLYKLP